MTRNCAPIALFVFNRRTHAEQTIAALKRNPLARESDLIIFSDAAKSPQGGDAVKTVREYIRSVEGFKSVTLVEQKKNLGLAASIIGGVSNLCAERGRVIVVEDDLITSRYFLQYMNDALDYYAEETRVAAISGFHPPFDVDLPDTFFLRDAECWGWATWRRAWSTFNADGQQLFRELEQKKMFRQFDQDGTYPYVRMLRDQIAGRNDSWAIRWRASVILNGMLSLYPNVSLTRNIGFDGSGTHGDVSDVWEGTDLSGEPIQVRKIALVPSEDAYKAFVRYNRRLIRRNLKDRIIRKLRAMVDRSSLNGTR